MSEKQPAEKLRILLPHWIEHNQGHATEFRRWSSTARTENMEEVASLIDRAADILEEADHLLSEALIKAGGPSHGGHHHHHHQD